jgi:hypothetical protein
VVAVGGAKARVARFLTRLHAAEEGPEGAVHPSQGLSGEVHGKRSDVLAEGTDLGQLLGLVIESDALAGRAPGVAPLLERGIIEFATEGERTRNSAKQAYFSGAPSGSEAGAGARFWAGKGS